MRCPSSSVALLLFSLFLTSAHASSPPSIESDIELTDWLLLPEVGSHGRVAMPTDTVTHALVRGTFEIPSVGDTVPLEEGKLAVWTAVTSPAEGPLRSELLRGGWASTVLHVEEPRRALLRAKGHVLAYVNGIPRVGNIYRYSYSLVPIELKAGDNHLLFRCRRYGTFEARLEPVSHDIMVNSEDFTLPEAVSGERKTLDAGIVFINTTTEGLDLSSAQGAKSRRGSHVIALPSYWMPPLSVAKLPVKLKGRRARGERLRYRIEGERVQPTFVDVDVVAPGAYRRVTFLSGVEGSAQYYGYRPRRAPHVGERPALMLHMHGASDEASAYRTLYHAKPWCSMASPTNRRPYGFGWESWGRIDALEVLDHATALSQPDPSRIYLGGHSMGGHGVWLNAALYPDKFAAAGPGAGWQDVWTYAGAEDFSHPDPVQKILQDSTNPSRTSLLAHNLKQLGIMLLHGDADRVVSIDEARGMAELLKAVGHRDWQLVVEPGGGHVWNTTPEVGHSAFDSIDLFEFFQRHSRPLAPQRLDFTTVMPSISATNHWLTVEQQGLQAQVSRARLQLDPGRRWLFGRLDNVERFSVSPETLVLPGPLTIQLDEEPEFTVDWKGGDLHFQRSESGWRGAEALSLSEKGPHRAGSARSVLMHNRPLLIVGTAGSPEENAWALQRARLCNERMWYRGNASFDIMLDTDFMPKAEPDRNVLLLGNADTNLAWKVLLAASPIQVNEGSVQVGTKIWKGKDLAALSLHPRPGSKKACVGFMAGSGIVGMRALDELSIFSARVFRPDFAVFSARSWLTAETAILATGFFGNDWSLEAGEVAWGETATP